MNSDHRQRKSSQVQKAPIARPASPPPSKNVQTLDMASLLSRGTTRWFLLAGVCVVSLLGLVVVLIAATVVHHSLQQPDETPVVQAEQPASAPTQPAPQPAILPIPTPPPAVKETEPEVLTMPKEKAEERAALQPIDVEPPPEVKLVRTVKPLNTTVKQGLEFLVKNQQADGGWGAAAAGFNGKGVDPRTGKQTTPAQDMTELGTTCVATLALLRSGSTPVDGPYAKNIAKGVSYILKKVESSDLRSITMTDQKNTQLQYKIGPFVDTFLSLVVLAELRGQIGNEKEEQRIMAAMQKTVNKIEQNQKTDGTFAGNESWAPVLSQGLAVKGLYRARQAGAKVSDLALDRTLKQVVTELSQKLDAGDKGRGRGTELSTFRSSGTPAPVTGDAGVSLYSISANLAGLHEAVATNEVREKKARAILSDDHAPANDRSKAKAEVARLEEARRMLSQAIDSVVLKSQDKAFVKGFGSNGGEEFLSFMNISETLWAKGGADYENWDLVVSENLGKAQDKEGSWSGHHCITGKTFCTSAALLVLMSDRAPLPVAAKFAEKPVE